MLTESVVLALAGGIAGVAFAYASVRFLLHLIPQHTFAISVNLSPDWRILAFSIGVCGVTGILFGLVPALQATRLGSDAVAEGNHGCCRDLSLEAYAASYRHA